MRLKSHKSAGTRFKSAQKPHAISLKVELRSNQNAIRMPLQVHFLSFHNDLKPNRKPVTETGFDDSGHETGFTETGFIETGLARHGETGFT